METNDICQRIADIHNTISQSQVTGENILIMADAMVQCRNLIQQLQSEQTQEAEKDGG